MSNLNTSNGKAEFANLIAETWSPRFYEAFKSHTKLVSLFSRDYEGEIKKKGDKVNVNAISVGAANTMTNDKEKFKSTGITITPFELSVNRITIEAVEISDLAQLQSESFMEELKKEMTYQVALKMEQEVIAKINADTTAYAIATSGTYVKNDWVNARTKAATLKWNELDKYSAFGPSYYGDLLKDSVITSGDYVNGKPLIDQKLPNILGFNAFEHNGLGLDQAMHFHYSALQMAVQKGMEFKISDLHSQNKLAYLLSVHIIWDMAMFDATRILVQENAGTAIGV